MVAIAAEGVGKSVFAMNWALKIPDPVLYITLDTSLTDQAIRVAAYHTGDTIQEVMRGHDDVQSWADKWEPILEEVHSRTRFFDHEFQAKLIDELVESETEYWGIPPLMTVVDNLGNLVEEESAQDYQKVLNHLHTAAKRHQTFMLALHHLRRKPAANKKDREDEIDDPGIASVHSDDILYAGGRNANFVLGLSKPEPNRMRVNVLKNRMGIASAAGKVSTHLNFDGARMRLDDVSDTEAYRRVIGRGEAA